MGANYLRPIGFVRLHSRLRCAASNFGALIEFASRRLIGPAAGSKQWGRAAGSERRMGMAGELVGGIGSLIGGRLLGSLAGA